MKLIKILFACCAVLINVSPAVAAELPFEGGWYVPQNMHSSCGKANYQAYDWVLGFDAKTATFGGSDGSCDLRKLSFNKRSSTYQTEWLCRSTDGDEAVGMSIKTDGPKGKIIALDGDPYVFCEAFR